MSAWLVKAIIAVAFGVCAIGAGLSGWAKLAAKSDPDLVLQVWPDHQRALLETANRGIKGGALRLMPVARRLMIAAPLSDAPLVIAGLSAREAGDTAMADKAFSAAYARSPRNILPRLWLADRAIAQADYMHAIGLIDGVIALNPPQGSDVFLNALADLARTKGGAEALSAYLNGRKIAWDGALLTRLNKTLDDLDMLIKLNAKAPSAQSSLIDRIYRERSPEAAFHAWLSFLDAREASQLSWPYDPEFKHKPAPLPFNWSVGAELIEFEKDGGLGVAYLGEGRPTLVSQIMMLRPGRYRLVAMMQGEGRDKGGSLAWSVSCVGDNRKLGSVTAKLNPDRQTSQAFDFAAPAGCDAQRVALVGEPGEFPLIVRSVVSRVDIVSLDRP